ncbi:type II secretion system protein GspM [Pseudomonas purpurea]|uniref:type II secretion system protein GspM n=1 Tax=Pseudomonas purpurea TaxID=3136737 RepID=UPI0032671D16
MNKPSWTVYRVRGQRLWSQGQQFWKSQTPRDQRLLLGCAALLGGLLVWLLLIQPPLKTLDYWQAETPKLRSQAQVLELLLRDVAAPAAGQNLEQTLRQSLHVSGLEGHYQLQPPDASRPDVWLLSFEAAPADAVVGWLLGNPRQFSLEVVEARLQRAGAAELDDTAGTLSGTVRMDQAPGAKEAS